MGFDLNKKTKLTIGRLARESGLSVTTIRYYQQRGLLRQPERPPTGSFRSYNENDLERLYLIRQTQELGFTLAEISELIAYVDNGNCLAIKGLARKKLQDIKNQIKLLDSKRKTLTMLLHHCTAESECSDECQLIQELRCPSRINGGNGKLSRGSP